MAGIDAAAAAGDAAAQQHPELTPMERVEQVRLSPSRALLLHSDPPCRLPGPPPRVVACWSGGDWFLLGSVEFTVSSLCWVFPSLESAHVKLETKPLVRPLLGYGNPLSCLSTSLNLDAMISKLTNDPLQ
jgi:hypothetical protein